MIREGREDRGWSQDQMAEALCAASGRSTVTRDEVKRWESGKITPGSYWLRHLADVLGLPLADLQGAARAARLERRTVLAASGALLLSARRREVADLLASIASGDEAWLSRQIVPYDVSVSLALLGRSDIGTRRRLTRWLHDGSTSLLRGNTQSVLFKSGLPELSELAEASMRHDPETRHRCMKCFSRRTFGLSWADAANYSGFNAPSTQIRTLAEILHDPADTSNRWCAAVYLGDAVGSGSDEARRALHGALRTEQSRENLRAIGLAMNGERPWK